MYTPAEYKPKKKRKEKIWYPTHRIYKKGKK